MLIKNKSHKNTEFPSTIIKVNTHHWDNFMITKSIQMFISFYQLLVLLLLTTPLYNSFFFASKNTLKSHSTSKFVINRCRINTLPLNNIKLWIHIKSNVFQPLNSKK